MALDTGDTAWMIVATGLVMLMTPGLGFFEAGLIRFKNGLSAIMHTFWFYLGLRTYSRRDNRRIRSCILSWSEGS